MNSCQKLKRLLWIVALLFVSMTLFIISTQDTYAAEEITPYIDTIRGIIAKRQVDASNDWKAFGESLTGEKIPDFDMDEHVAEYMGSDKKSDTYLGKFFQAALSQKQMVSTRIMESGSRLAGWDMRLIKRQALHAKHLSFPHPVSKEIVSISCPLPEDMSRVICTLRELR